MGLELLTATYCCRHKHTQPAFDFVTLYAVIRQAAHLGLNAMNNTLFHNLWQVLAVVLLLAAGSSTGLSWANESGTDFETEREQLAVLQAMIGNWKGVGLQKLGGRDRWGATTAWAWDFTDGKPAIVFSLTPGRSFASGRIVTGDSPGTFALTITDAAERSSATFTGRQDADGQLELTNPQAANGELGRLLIKNVADNKRLVIIAQQRSAGERYLQTAVLGYTREGTVFATRQRPEHECVVTGGEGNQRVTYGGEEYWVCCKGCLSMFQTNPEKVIAAHKARLEKRRKREQAASSSD